MTLTPSGLLIVFGVAIVLGITAWWLLARRDVGRWIEGGLDELRETVPTARTQVYHRTKARMEENLALAEAKLNRISARLAFVARLWVDEASTFVAEHRRALGRWLFLFDAGAQTAITAVQRPGLTTWLYPLQGISLAVIYAAFGVVAVLLTALAFRRRPPRGWAVIDGIALVTGFGAVLAAVALLIGRAVMDPAAIASLEPYADTLLSPLIVWGGFAAGLAQGVAHLQTEGDRLARDKRRLESEIAARSDGLRRLEDLARELGVLAVLLTLLLTPARIALGQTPTPQVTATVVAGPHASTPLQRRVPLSPDCAIILDGSSSPDRTHLQRAIDSSVVVLRYQIERAQCRRILATVASSDTVWMAQRWFPVPSRPNGGQCSRPPGSSGAWAAMLRGLSPVAAAERRTDSTTRCSGHADSSSRAYQAGLSSVLANIAVFLRASHPISSPDTTALVEMIAFLGSGRFSAGVLVTDGIETKRPDSIPEMASATQFLALVLVPTTEKSGGAARSLAAARGLAARIRGLDLLPYTAVSSYADPGPTPGDPHP